MKFYWILLEKVKDGHLFFLYNAILFAVSSFKLCENKYLLDSVLEVKKTDYNLIFKLGQFKKASKDVLNKLLKNLNWVLKINDLIEEDRNFSFKYYEN